MSYVLCDAWLEDSSLACFFFFFCLECLKYMHTCTCIFCCVLLCVGIVTVIKLTSDTHRCLTTGENTAGGGIK